MRIGLEVGTHSPWVSRHLCNLGHEVIPANPRKVRLIAQSRTKDDRSDARHLARLARVDPSLLFPVRHRSERTQADLAVVRARDLLVRFRTGLISSCRNMVKSFGARLETCSAVVFPHRALRSLPPQLEPALVPLLEQIEAINKQIKGYDTLLETELAEKYPQTRVLRQIHGVGAVTALTFVLILEDHKRFKRSREVGAYLGLTPGRRASGNAEPDMRITKEGDRFLRRLLVGSAHYILRRSSPDTDLKRHGEKIVTRGGKRAKKRAVVAVARKLAVLLHHLWSTAEVYEPLHNTQKAHAA